MSLHHLAQQLQTKGRGPDTELVHMTKGELAGLQSLAQAHGKSLTINPHTGLPEAGILRAILPAATTAAATYFGGPQAGATVAAMWGAKTYADTGSLTKGLITGIGAYGGSQLAAGMSPEMGTSALGETSGAATSGSEAALADAGKTAQMSQADVLAQSGSPSMASNAGMGSAAPNATTSSGVSDLATKTSEAGGTSGLDYSAPKVGSQGIQALQTPSTAPDVTQTNYSLTGPKADYTLAKAPPTGIDQLPNAAPSAKPPVDNWAQFKQNATMKNVGMSLAPVMLEGGPQAATGAPEVKGDANMGQRYAYSSGFNPQTGTYTGKDTYRPVSDSEAKALYGFAEGGDVQGDPNLMQVKTYDPVVRMAGGGISDAVMEAMRKLQAQGGMNGDSSTGGYTYDPETQTYTRTAAAGGISDLGSYSDGGRLLKGPGDGVSDSIPAQIGANQPARLADGEFVVPARIVSELGNGSTDAGARQLYKMMDRVQKARSKTTAKGKMAKDTNAAKYLPA